MEPTTQTTTSARAKTGTATKVAVAIAQTVGGAIMLAVLSQVLVPLPFSPVPLSLGTLAAMSLGALLGPRLGMSAATVYAVAGSVGLPIFAGMQAGVMVSSFGYVIGYIAAAGLVGAYVHRGQAITFLGALSVTLVASASILAFGSAWLVLAVGMSVPAAIAAGVTPFLIGDAIKSVVVAGTAYGVNVRRTH